jgi:RNA polymerase sigma-70 factor (ECF subfamily)
MATGTAEDIANELAASDSLEDDEAATRELSTCLKPLMSGLTAADQEALQMVEFDGVTQVEAAARLGLSVSGMKSRVQRARSHLRSALHDCCRIAVDRRGGVISYEGRSGNCESCAPPDSDSGSGCS